MGVNTCTYCGETYPISHLGDDGTCRLCLVRLPAIRRKIAAEIHALGGSAFMVEQVKRGPGWHLRGGLGATRIADDDPPVDP